MAATQTSSVISISNSTEHYNTETLIIIYQMDGFWSIEMIMMMIVVFCFMICTMVGIISCCYVYRKGSTNTEEKELSTVIQANQMNDIDNQILSIHASTKINMSSSTIATLNIEGKTKTPDQLCRDKSNDTEAMFDIVEDDGDIITKTHSNTAQLRPQWNNKYISADSDAIYEKPKKVEQDGIKNGDVWH